MGKKSKNQSTTTDIVIFVTGVSGVGKSTFINNLLNEHRMPVGHGVDPCTKELREVEVHGVGFGKYEGRRVYIVDTPGFNSPDATDLEILKRMAAWLKKRWPYQSIDGGVIYLHNIQDDRYSTLASTDLSMLRNSFGQLQGTSRRIVLATTKWHRSNMDESKRRQMELQKKQWKNLVAEGTSVMEFNNSHESAEEIVKTLLENCLNTPASFDIKEKLDELMQVQTDTSSHGILNFLRFFGLFSRRY
ncbi:hypothetical protein GALMADRAFT_249714 [Galerina marginata CBS 339.88]|uniref:G domain-containing protein n=1 Tax=Galerina marginata (strain CBS 339.88) TaxID=685588 RepID=A0A067T4F6_GALM3|nr:hypothetical protein GALMADRAFT_249714 [Galerina marginata CBS 339.88]